MTPITHIFLLKFKESVSPSERLSCSQQLLTLQQTCLHNGKPYLTNISCGACQNNGPESKGFHQVYVLTFESKEMLDYFMTEDPAHMESQKALGGFDIVEDSVNFDFVPGVFDVGAEKV